MRPLYFILFIFSLAVSACAPNLPPAVSDDLLRKATPEEAKNLELLERSMIDLPDQKIEIQKKIARSESELKLVLLDQEMAQDALQTGKQAMEQAKKDKADTTPMQMQIDQAQKALGELSFSLELAQTKLEADQAELALKEAEINVMVAQQRLVQVNIGIRVQTEQLAEASAIRKKQLAGEQLELKPYLEFLAFHQRSYEASKSRFSLAKQKHDFLLAQIIGAP